MAFAIFYNGSDLADMAAQFNDASIGGKDRNDGRTFWNNGLSGWQTAPLASSDPVGRTQPDVVGNPTPDPNVRIIVVQNNTLAAFRQYLYTLASKYPARCVFLGALADDLASRQSAVEPWPWTPAGTDPWAAFRTP
jgi:hypothetical protein